MDDSSPEELAPILKEILKWIKFAGSKEVKNVLKDALDTDQKLLVYHLSDGTKGTREIAKKAGIGKTTVATWWKSWARRNIVNSIKVKGGGERYKKIFDLEDFGITIPEITVKKKTKTANVQKERDSS